MTTTKDRLWTVEEYHRLIEAGILTIDDKVELLDGHIVEMSPQYPPHAATTQRCDRYFQNLLQERAYIRIQLPITLSTSEPEPDIAIVKINPSFYGECHPVAEDIFLLIEIADSTIRKDRKIKASIYARDNILEYWILDISKRQVYIFRNPSTNGYESETIIDATASLSPVAFPDIEVFFSELFLL